MLTRLLILLALAASPGLAADAPMSAEQFDAFTRGKTLFYGEGGQPYGVERYLDDRRVIWSFLDGNCKAGEWYEDRGRICFVYEDRPEESQCWTFRQSGGRLIARYETDPLSTEIYEAEDLGAEMLCHGPDVGV